MQVYVKSTYLRGNTGHALFATFSVEVPETRKEMLESLGSFIATINTKLDNAKLKLRIIKVSIPVLY